VQLADQPDNTLVRCVCNGDVRAFEALYDRYCRLVYSIALRALNDPTTAEDVVQEAFFRLWERAAQFDGSRGPFVAWLIGVARNRAIDERRRHSRRLRLEAPGMVEQDLLADNESTDPCLAGVISEQRAAVRDALGALPVEQRFVLELAYFQGLTQQEIANALGHPLGTVKTRIRLGMRKVRSALEAEHESGDI
jgi:RNA polymerase sigma-70 factor (ECF subfamily)